MRTRKKRDEQVPPSLWREDAPVQGYCQYCGTPLRRMGQAWCDIHLGMFHAMPKLFLLEGLSEEEWARRRRCYHGFFRYNYRTGQRYDSPVLLRVETPDRKAYTIDYERRFNARWYQEILQPERGRWAGIVEYVCNEPLVMEQEQWLRAEQEQGHIWAFVTVSYQREVDDEDRDESLPAL